jgi:hypothetical protein
VVVVAAAVTVVVVAAVVVAAAGESQTIHLISFDARPYAGRFSCLRRSRHRRPIGASPTLPNML